MRASTLETGPRALRELYARVRAATSQLVEPLRPEDCVVQSMPDTSPTKWHMAHTSWFFETFVLPRAVKGYGEFEPGFTVLFNSYYHAAGDRHPRPERGLLSRPTVEEVFAYRAHVDRWMDRVLCGEHGPIDPELHFVIELGLNHEEQHQELLLTDIKHALAMNPLQPAYRELDGAPMTVHVPPVLSAEEWACFDGGLVEIGAEEESFTFDNERPRHRHWLGSFELARRPVTCGEYEEFIADGGYTNSEHWLSDGWDACVRSGWEAPLYWNREGKDWSLLTLNGTRHLDENEPVSHVSFYEADAYARWRGARLPLESEWEHAAAAEDPGGNLLDKGLLHPAPVAKRGKRLDQVFGEVWEWTSSPYAPYPGFEPFRGAIGEYNGKWMNSRYVLRGGSCVTPARHIRTSYRNFFGPEARWQFSGIRLARSPQ